eukprot:6829787-Prymnesium_polylepis.1
MSPSEPRGRGGHCARAQSEVLSRAMEATFFAAWTVEERAGLSLDEGFRPRLARLYDEGEIPMAMVTKLNVTAPSMESRKEFWGDVCEAMEIEEPQRALSRLKRAAMVAWLENACRR